MMLQIVFDHFIRHLANSGAKIAALPKMSSPISLFQVREFFEQIARSSSLDSPHDFARSHIRRCTYQDMHMIFAHNTFDDPYLKGFTRLPHQVSHSFRYFTLQHFITILGYPNKMVLNLVNRMAAISIVPPLGQIIAAKANRLKPVV